MKLIVGLGNPGDQYKDTLHNAGFMGIDYLREYFNFNEFKNSNKHQAELVEGQITGEKILLAKSQTFMNLSGQAVQSIVHFYKLNPKETIVIYDDADLPFGTLRIRSSGSSGGHKGVESVIDHLGQDFIRIRLGIKPKELPLGPLEYYVLSKISSKDQKDLQSTIKKLPVVIETLIKEGIEEVQQHFN